MMGGQAPELCNVIGGGNSHLEQKRSGGATLVIVWSHGERGTVRHGRDRVGLDQILTLRIAPDLTRITVYGLVQRRRGRKPMHIGPLLDDLARVGRYHGCVHAAVPHAYPRPRSLVWRGTPHQVAPHAGRTRGTLEHTLESFLDIRGCAIRQARDNGAAG